MAKSNRYRILAGFLSLVMIVSMFPTYAFTTVFASEVASYSVRLTDGKKVLALDDVAVTLTNKENSAKTATVKTAAGVATFNNFVEEGAAYTISVAPVAGYEDTASTQVTVAAGDTSADVVMTALKKVTVSGVVTDEKGKPYEGASVNVTGYITTKAVTNAAGEYSFETYANKSNVISVTAKSTDKKYNTITNTKVYSADTKNANYQLSVKTFSIKTTAGENGHITEGETGIPYGSSKTIEIHADEGYRINQVTINGTEEPKAAGQKAYKIDLADIKEDYDIAVSFYRMTYKITFTVGKNGDVSYGDDVTQVIAGGDITIDKNFNEATDPAHPTTVTITAKPKPNYRVSQVVIDGEKQSFTENDYVYVTKDHNKDLVMTENHTFAVEFARNEHTLSVSCGNHGSASWGSGGTETKAKHGDSAVLSITPDAGYAVSSVTVNNQHAQPTEDDDGLFLKFDAVTEDKSVSIQFAQISQPTPSDKLSNEYYSITFDKEPLRQENSDDGTYVVVLPSDATATLQPTSPYIGIRYNQWSSYGKYHESITFSETITIKNVYVKKTLYPFGNRIGVDVNVKIIIDKEAPVIADIPQQEWVNSDTVTISGSVSDHDNSSGLNYVVWSKDTPLTPDQVLAATENKVSIIGGDYSFTSIPGEQNSTYYVYATDNVGNVSEAKTVQIKIDKKNPAITGFTFSTDPNTLIDEPINFTSFGTVYKDKMYLTVTATDETITSGLKTISLYYGSTLLDTQMVSGNSAVFELTEIDFRNGAEIYAVAHDAAGNPSLKTKPTDAGVTTNAKSSMVQITANKPTAAITSADEVYQDASGKPWYNKDVEFTVTAKDNVSGIRFVEIIINGEKLTADANGVDLTQDFSQGSSPINEKTFTVNTAQHVLDGKNTIEVTVTSVAGQKSQVYTEDVYIDTTDPDVVGYEITTLDGASLDKELNFLTFGTFYNEQVKITVTAHDKNATVGVKEITLYLDGAAFDTQKVNEKNQASFIVSKDKLAENTVFTGDISAVAWDHVNNHTEVPVAPAAVNPAIKHSALMLENVAPTASIEPVVTVPDANPVTQDGKHWYPGDVEFNVTVGDVDSGIRSAVITINGTEVAKESFYNDSNGDTQCNSKTYTVNTGDPDVVIAQDGSYTVIATVTDNAGNVFASEPYVVFKDVDKPYITGFDFNADEFIEGSENIEDAVISTDYGFYFKTATEVAISAKDPEPSSGIKSITYYTVDYTNNANGVKSDAQTLPVNEDNEIIITIPANFKGQIYATATDNVLNASAAPASPNGVIIENEDKHSEEDHITFAMPKTPFTTADNTALYDADVDVTITVADTYSGIREIQWDVTAPYDTNNNQSGKVTLNNDKTVVDGTETDWKQTKTQLNLVTEMQKTIKVKNNSNDITVSVRLTDRAGNVSVEKTTLSIDKTNPVINIVYGGDEVHDGQYTDYFSTKRTATITITERNFSPSDVAASITNTMGPIPSVNLKSASSWSTSINSANPDKTTHVAKVMYTADGDYTFNIAYSDLAKNPANTVPQQRFTIDMTKPIVSVTYSNNSALNGNYYNADRIATITIKERNFDPARVKIMGTATDNGSPAKFPVISTWTNHGDTHTAKIAYTADGKYSFDIEFADKANNSMENYGADEFYVDKTAPTLSITGVADQSANKGTIAPVVTYQDTNFDKNAVTISLSGVNNGPVDYSGSYAAIKNGQTFTYANFEEIQEVDDIYTLSVKLTDLAGNQAEQVITFSANRFGSVYDLSQIKDMIAKYHQVEQDIVFTETNVDSLDRKGIKIKLTKNGTPYDLVEGADYTVEVSGGNGQWSVYKYTIKKELFASDGKYSLSIYSKDAAGNVNENIDESKAAEISFGIDKTSPVIVPIDLESGVQYAVDMKTVSVEIKDNLVLENVKIYLNGSEVQYTVDGETYTFDIPKSNTKQDVEIVAYDAAGNELSVEITDFLVNANIFVRWFNNTPLFVGTIVAASFLVLGAVFLIVIIKKKKKEDKAKV